MKKLLFLCTLMALVFSLPSMSFSQKGDIADLIKQERKELKSRKERALKNCDLTALGNKTKKKCLKDTKKKYKKNLLSLETDPTTYFKNK